jgi:predicted dehydrogenase
MVRRLLLKSKEKVSADVVKVVVEKPFTVSTEEADRVIAAQKKSGKILTVFQSPFLLPPLFYTLD